MTFGGDRANNGIVPLICRCKVKLRLLLFFLHCLEVKRMHFLFDKHLAFLIKRRAHLFFLRQFDILRQGLLLSFEVFNPWKYLKLTLVARLLRFFQGLVVDVSEKAGNDLLISATLCWNAAIAISADTFWEKRCPAQVYIGTNVLLKGHLKLLKLHKVGPDGRLSSRVIAFLLLSMLDEELKDILYVLNLVDAEG